MVIRNIYYMMAYAFRAVHIGESARFGEEDFDSVDDLLSAVLVNGIETQRKRGFECEYGERKEITNIPRGRIDVVPTMLRRARKAPAVECVFDEYTENTAKNQILKATARVLLHSPQVSPERKQGIKRQLLFLRDVDDVDPAHIRWPRFYHRNDGSYQLLMNLCYLVIEGCLPSHEGGERKLADFIDEQALHALYERFLLAYFQRHHPRLNPRARMIDPALSKGAPSFVPRLCTDVTLTTQERTLIIDAKCYGKILNWHYGRDILPTQNYHQLFTYVATEQYNVPHKQVEGMLLYARTGLDSALNSSWTQAGYHLHARTLDLGQDFSGIRDQLDQIAALL